MVLTLASRSPCRTGKEHRVTLALIDLQDRLVPALSGGTEMVAAAGRLLEGSRLLGRRVVTTEQAPDKLGPTVADLSLPSPAFAKVSFDASAILLEHIPPGEVITIAGCETHICVRQTVIGLLRAGRPVVIAVDAVASRKVIDRETALGSLSRLGAELSTVEAILFDWIGSADHPQFRAFSRLIK